MLIKRPKIPVSSILLIGFLPGFIKKLYYRLNGYKLGKNVSIGPGSVIIGKNVTICDHAKIGFLTVIRAREISIARHVQIGSLTMIDTERFHIGEDSRINEKVIVGGIRTPDSMLKIGKRAIIMEYSFINPTKPIIIGDDTGIGGHCLLFTHGSWLSQLEGFPVVFAPITLGNNVWLPWRVFIMPGVTLGDHVVIGANSLISRDVPSNCMAAGSPAKIIKENYPDPLSAEARHEIFINILQEFSAYISYNGLVSSLSESDSGIVIEIRKKRAISRILVLLKPVPHKSGFPGYFDLLVTDGIETKESGFSSPMKIDLKTKSRSGSSNVGEEFARFLSRYGIRFNRLD